MAAGGPGDHPLSDVLRFNLEVYGDEADSLLRDIAKLMDYDRLYVWFDENRLCAATPSTAEELFRKKLITLRKDAKERGWDPDDRGWEID